MDDKNKKYEFIDACKWGGVVLHRIQALKDIYGVAKAGDIGGWVESEDNLSHEGLCWVGGDAKVYGRAQVYEDAQVRGNADVCGNAKVYGHCKVYGCAILYGEAQVYGNAEVYDYAKIYGHAHVRNCAQIHGFAKVYDYAEVYGDALVYDEAEVFGHAQVCEYATVDDFADVSGNSVMHGYVELNGYAKVCDGELTSCHDYLTVGPIGSRDAYTTLNLTTGTVQTGCFKGTLDEFERAVKKTHHDSKYADEYNKLIAYFRTLQNTCKINS